MAWLGWTSTPIRPGAAGAVTGPASADKLTSPPRERSSASLAGPPRWMVSSRARSRCPAVDRLGRAGRRPEGLGQPAVVDGGPLAGDRRHLALLEQHQAAGVVVGLDRDRLRGALLQVLQRRRGPRRTHLLALELGQRGRLGPLADQDL